MSKILRKIGYSFLFVTFLMLGLVPCVSPAYGQIPDENKEEIVKAVASLEEEELLMGKLMPLTIEITLPNDSSNVEFPLLIENLKQKKKYVLLANDSVELLTKYKLSKEMGEHGPFLRYNLYLQSFDSGRYELPPLEFIVNGEKVNTNSLTLSVIPVKASADDQLDDFSDIAEPFEIMPADMENLMTEEKSSAWIWWLVAASVALLAILIYLYLRFKANGSIILRKALPPYQIALNKLNKLQKDNLPAKGKKKEYYTRLSDIVRNYIHSQFDIKTLEKTTSEILDEVSRNERLEGYINLLESILETSDFVKFAKVNPSDTEDKKCMDLAFQFIEKSHPITDKETEKGGSK